MAITYSDVKWWQFVKPGNTFLLGKNNRLRIEREIIPIIVIPGIMGSRLKRGNKIVWDPDHLEFMWKNYGSKKSTPAYRKRMLIGEQFNANYLGVSEKDQEHNQDCFYLSDEMKAYGIHDPGPDREERGWGGVFWGSFAKLLLALETRNWHDPVGTCFDFPVHAFGYNWTDTNANSGKKLQEYIAKTIKSYKKYQGQERICKYVILVTHSMGGMVARSACKLHGAENDVLGVIHGAQPTTGSAAAYWRMKAGFERNGLFGIDPLAWVLGKTGEEVTCILGNSPGGLELLPNKYYKDNKGNASWLHVPLQNGTTRSFPQSGDPYSEIYRNQDDVFWRMVNPAWLDPISGIGVADSSRPTSLSKKAWGKYLKCLSDAEDFHEKLGANKHDPTYQFYSTGLDTVDRIQFSRETLAIRTQTIADEYGNTIMEYPVPSIKSDYRGEYKIYADKDDKEIRNFNTAPYVVRMGMPKDYGKQGDGTVPVSSSKHLSAKGMGEVKNVGHQNFFEDGKAREYVFNAIWNLAQARITEGIQKQG